MYAFVCVTLAALVGSTFAQNGNGMGFCLNQGQTCNLAGGRSCCTGFSCQNSMGNMRTCQRNINGGSLCLNQGQTCNLAGTRSCCTGFSCQASVGNIRTCQRNMNGGNNMCRSYGQECWKTGAQEMRCCNNMMCVYNQYYQLVCQ
ncbi:egg protein CP422-like [Haliotis cracherodii]|uniref:egg protein CP422-like n=1 Tax=Haliotis cracherodii TaxID=6455 RepID=UPI0039E8F5EE